MLVFKNIELISYFTVNRGFSKETEIIYFKEGFELKRFEQARIDCLTSPTGFLLL